MTPASPLLPLQDLLRIPAPLQRLGFQSRELPDDRTLADCGLERDSTIALALRSRGGKPVVRAGREQQVPPCVAHSVSSLNRRGLKPGTPCQRKNTSFATRRRC